MQEPDPAPRDGRIFTRQEDIEHDGFSLAMMGSRRFYVKDGKAYTPDDKRELVGTLSEVAFQCKLQADGFTEEQLMKTKKGKEYLQMIKEDLGC